MAFLTDAHRASHFPSPLDALARAFRVAVKWNAIAAERRALGELDPSRLCDLGLNAADAKREAQKPFWLNRRS